GHQIGLISDERYEKFTDKKAAIEKEIKRFRSTFIKPNEQTQAVIKEAGGSALKDGIRAADLVKRPEMSYQKVIGLIPLEEELPEDVIEQVEIQLKYEGYIEKSLQQVEKLKKLENKKIPEQIDYE